MNPKITWFPNTAGSTLSRIAPKHIEVLPIPFPKDEKLLDGSSPSELGSLQGSQAALAPPLTLPVTLLQVLAAAPSAPASSQQSTASGSPLGFQTFCLHSPPSLWYNLCFFQSGSSPRLCVAVSLQPFLDKQHNPCTAGLKWRFSCPQSMAMEMAEDPSPGR